MATSPFVTEELADPCAWANSGANNPAPSSPLPMVPAPPTARPFKKERRLSDAFGGCAFFSICSMILYFLRIVRVLIYIIYGTKLSRDTKVQGSIFVSNERISSLGPHRASTCCRLIRRRVTARDYATPVWRNPIA